VRPLAAVEFPPEVEETYRRARRLEWITLAYLASTATLLFLTMGTSQAMRTSFFEDLVSLVPAAAFLIGTAIARRIPSSTYPYGLHRATSIAHLVAAVALCAVGLSLLVDAGLKVAAGEKPTIGGVSLFGAVVWAGWPMLAALVYASLPSYILGRMKLKLAPQLHDKVLHADAKMMKADWMAATASAVGVIGTGFGFWWLDPLAAALVSLDILKDGVENLGTAVADLIDRRPRKSDGSDWEHLPSEIRGLLLKMDWVEAAEVRLREAGHVFVGDALVVPRPGTEDLVAKLGQAAEEAKALDWRVHDVAMVPVERLPG
jgi:divalent metal cation (Fe/Co/Zn/Cd) transporter